MAKELGSERRSSAIPGWLLLAFVAFISTPASAATYALSGKVRYQIGGALPLPITFVAAPVGAVQAISGATAEQVTTVPGLPRNLVLKPGQLLASGTPITVPVFLANPLAFQAQTSLAVAFPGSTATFKASGRTGVSTVTFCPGNTGTVLGNGCLMPPTAPGQVRYTRTVSQFGGPALGVFAGGVSVAARFAGTPPCTACVAGFVDDRPPGAFGGPFGLALTQSNPAISPGAFFASVAPNGTILSLKTPLGPAVANPIQSFAGPWPTGRVTVSQPSAMPPQVFVFSGNDGRTASGQGTISLVSGGIVQRGSAFGPETTRGWLNLTTVPEPSLVSGLATGAVALVWLGRRRRRYAG
jgi:hypothetical protein